MSKFETGWEFGHAIISQFTTRFLSESHYSKVEQSFGLPPVITAYGAFKHGGPLPEVRKVVLDKGHSIFVPPLGENIAELDRSADIVEKMISDEHLLGPIYIGYSYGGIIGWELMRRKKISRLITIASPLFGTVWAEKLPFLNSIGSLTLDSEVLQKLWTETRDMHNRIFSIYAENDEFVKSDIKSGEFGAVVNEVFELDGIRTVVLPGCDHTSVLKHPDLSNYLIKELDNYEKLRYIEHNFLNRNNSVKLST